LEKLRYDPMNPLGASSGVFQHARRLNRMNRLFRESYSPEGPEVSAGYNKGALKIKLARKAEAKPKRIKINVGAEKTPEAKTPEAEPPGKAA
jgi:hypothetical protein